VSSGPILGSTLGVESLLKKRWISSTEMFLPLTYQQRAGGAHYIQETGYQSTAYHSVTGLISRTQKQLLHVNKQSDSKKDKGLEQTFLQR